MNNSDKSAFTQVIILFKNLMVLIWNSHSVSFVSDGKPPSFIRKVLIGVFAGGVGAFVGTPAELALIRMTADGR